MDNQMQTTIHKQRKNQTNSSSLSPVKNTSYTDTSKKSSLNKLVSNLKQRINNKCSLDKYVVHEETDIANLILESYIKIVSFNVGKMRSDEGKRLLVKNLIIREDPDICFLQETNLLEDDNYKIDGYETFLHFVHSGLICLIKETICRKEEDVNTNFGYNIESQIFKINVKNLEFFIINLYRNCNPDKSASLDVNKLFTYMEEKKYALVLGDFNAHNPIWRNYDVAHPSCLTTCSTGKDIEKGLNQTSIVSLNTGEPTHASGSAIDLAFATKNLANKAFWSVNDMSVSAYDHFGTTVFLQLEKINFPNSQPKKLYNKANWDTFKKAADMHIENSNLNEYSTKDLNALNDKNKQFVDMIIEAEKQAVPVKT